MRIYMFFEKCFFVDRVCRKGDAHFIHLVYGNEIVQPVTLINPGNESIMPETSKGEAMKDNLRVSVAYIAGSIINKKNYSSLIDQSQNKTYQMNGNFDLGNIDVQNHGEGSKIVGMMSGSEVSFFHSVENVSISLKLNGTDFKGHDNGSDKDFTGSVNGKSVKIYDLGEYKNFYYALGD